MKPFDPHELCSRVRLHFRLRGALETVALTGGCGLRPDAAGEPDEARARFLAHVHDVTVAALTKVAELRDTETGEHLVRMRSYTQIVAEELGRHGPYAEQIDERFLEDLYRASPLHDIGKVGINDAILLKPARLTPEEFETMKQHTTIGANILDHVAFGAPDASFLGMAAVVARFHHERFDGSGYPAGLRGTEIPLPARIVAIADAYDAITSIRPYKAPQPATAARDIIQEDSGSHFDPVVVEAFLRRFDTLASVHKQDLRSDPGRRRGQFLPARAVGCRWPIAQNLESNMEPNPSTAEITSQQCVFRQSGLFVPGRGPHAGRTGSTCSSRKCRSGSSAFEVQARSSRLEPVGPNRPPAQGCGRQLWLYGDHALCRSTGSRRARCPARGGHPLGPQRASRPLSPRSCRDGGRSVGRPCLQEWPLGRTRHYSAFVPGHGGTGVYARFGLQPVIGPAFMPGKAKPRRGSILLHAVNPVRPVYGSPLVPNADAGAP